MIIPFFNILIYLVDLVDNGEIDFSDVDIEDTVLQRNCPPTPKCDKNRKYRTIDGTCNNLRNPRLGQVFTPLQRILPNAYADGKKDIF